MPNSTTPNVVVQNPAVRKAASVVIGTALIVLPSLAIVEAHTGLSFEEWLPAATAVTAFLAGVFGIVVTTPNIPTRDAAEPAESAEPAEPIYLIESMQDAYADDGSGETVELDGDGDALDGSIEISETDGARGKYAAE